MADTKQQWYKDAKYGLFIHWGLYSILAGEWKDPKTGEVTKTDRIAEWIENNLNIDKEDSFIQDSWMESPGTWMRRRSLMDVTTGSCCGRSFSLSASRSSQQRRSSYSSMDTVNLYSP